MERYVFVVRVEVLDGELREGDALSVIYGDTSGGSRGMQAAIVSDSRWLRHCLGLNLHTLHLKTRSSDMCDGRAESFF